MVEGPERKVAVIAPAEVPAGLQDLIATAERWGMRSNPQRDELLESATTDELRTFVGALEPRCPEIDAWLDSMPQDSGQWPKAAVAFLWLRKTWHDAACELSAREKETGT